MLEEKQEQGEHKAFQPVIDIGSLQTSDRFFAESEEGDRRKRHTYSFADLHKLKDIEQEFLIDDLLPKSSVTVFMGVDGIGKSAILSQLCLQVCLDVPNFCGCKLKVKNRNCVFVGTEDAKVKFARSVGKQAKAIKPDYKPEEVGLHFTEASMFDNWDELTEEIELLLADFTPEVIVVDTLSDMFGLKDSEINSNDAARKILSYFQMIADSTGAAVIIVHHVSKTKIAGKKFAGTLFLEKDDAQGAGAITQKARTVLALTNDKASNVNGKTYTNYLHSVKGNMFGKKYEINAIKLEFQTETLLHKFDSVVDIFEVESERKKEAGEDNDAPRERGTSGQKKVAQPSDIEDADHWQKLTDMYKGFTVLGRQDLLKRICTAYAIGMNKAQQTGGYMDYLTSKGWLQKSGAGWAFTGAKVAHKVTQEGDEELPF